jgi:hypothetical protein
MAENVVYTAVVNVRTDAEQTRQIVRNALEGMVSDAKQAQSALGATGGTSGLQRSLEGLIGVIDQFESTMKSAHDLNAQGFASAGVDLITAGYKEAQLAGRALLTTMSELGQIASRPFAQLAQGFSNTLATSASQGTRELVTGARKGGQQLPGVNLGRLDQFFTNMQAVPKSLMAAFAPMDEAAASLAAAMKDATEGTVAQRRAANIALNQGLLLGQDTSAAGYPGLSRYPHLQTANASGNVSAATFTTPQGTRQIVGSAGLQEFAGTAASAPPLERSGVGVEDDPLVEFLKGEILDIHAINQRIAELRASASALRGEAIGQVVAGRPKAAAETGFQATYESNQADQLRDALALRIKNAQLATSQSQTGGSSASEDFNAANAFGEQRVANLRSVPSEPGSALADSQSKLRDAYDVVRNIATVGGATDKELSTASTGLNRAIRTTTDLIVAQGKAAATTVPSSTQLAEEERVAADKIAAAAIATENAARASRIQQQLTLKTLGTRSIGGGNTISATEGGVFAADGSLVSGLTAVSAATRTAAPLLERQALAQDKANRTLIGSFAHGITQGGWAGGQGEGNPLGGLLETAGVLTKYAIVGRSLQEVSRLGRETLTDFANLDKAIQLYNQVIGGSNAASDTFVNSLENISRAAGVNAVDALNAATKGVAAFSNETTTASQKQQIGQQFVVAATQNAVITGQPVSGAANDIIAVGTSFGIASQGLNSINDAIATAHSTFGSSTLDISNGLKLLADDGKQAGYSMAQLAQVVGLDAARLAESGDEVATNLQRVFAQFQSKAGQSQLQAVGVNTLGTVKTQIEGLAAVYPDLNQKQQQNILNVLGGAKAMKELIPLLSDNTALQDAFTKTLTDQGAGSKLASAGLNSLAGQLKVIAETIKNIGLDIARTGIFDPLIFALGLLKPALQSLDSLLQLYDKLPSVVKGGTAVLLEGALALSVFSKVRANAAIGGAGSIGGLSGALRNVTGRGGGAVAGDINGRAVNEALAQWETASAKEATAMDAAARAQQLANDETTKSTITVERLRQADELLLKATTGATEALVRLLDVTAGATGRGLAGRSVAAQEAAATGLGGGRRTFAVGADGVASELSNTGKGALSSISSGIKTGASKIGSLLGSQLGGVGIALLGAILVNSAINASTAISQAITASAQLVSKTVYGTTSTALEQQASDLSAAAAADKHASHGLIASSLNSLEGNPTGASANIASTEAATLATAAASLAAIEAQKLNSANVGDIASTIDLSSATALSTSLTTLASTGLGAQQQMDALNRAILRVTTSGGNLAGGTSLTPLQAQAAGINSTAALAASFAASQQLYQNVKNSNDAVGQIFTSEHKNLDTIASGFGKLVGNVFGKTSNPFGDIGQISRGVLGADTLGAFQQRRDLSVAGNAQPEWLTGLLNSNTAGIFSPGGLNGNIKPADAAVAQKALAKVNVGDLSAKVGNTITAGLQSGPVTPDVEAEITNLAVAQMEAAIPGFASLVPAVRKNLVAGWTAAIRSQIDTATGANSTAATDAITFAAAATFDATNAQAAGAAAGVKAALSGGNQQLVTAQVTLTNMLTDRDALIQLAIASGLDTAQAMVQYNGLLNTAELAAVTAKIQAQSSVTTLGIAQLGPFNKTAALAAQAAGDARNAALQAQTITTYSNNGQVPTGTKQILTVADQTTAATDASNQLQQKIANDQSARLAAIAPGNTVGLATATLRNDQQTLNQIKDKGTKEYTDAYLAVQTDLRAVADAQNQLGTAIAGAYIDPQDPLAAAHVAVSGLINKIRTADTKGTLQWFQDQAALAQAQQAVVTAQLTANAVLLSLQTDQTNPVTVAKDALIAAQAKQAADNANPRTDVNTKNADRLATQSASQSLDAAQFSQNLSDLQTADQLGRISHQTYLKYLKTQQQQIEETSAYLNPLAQGHRAAVDKLNQIDQAILAANNQLVGQFNIGQVKVPTPYEVRRSLATQAVGQQYQSTNSSVVINVNGANYDQVATLLGTYLGPVTTGQYTVASRKA